VSRFGAAMRNSGNEPYSSPEFWVAAYAFT